MEGGHGPGKSLRRPLRALPAILAGLAIAIWQPCAAQAAALAKAVLIGRFDNPVYVAVAPGLSGFGRGFGGVVYFAQTSGEVSRVTPP